MSGTDPRSWWETGGYDSGDPAADADARRIFLMRQQRLGAGWHRRRWSGPDGAELSRQLDARMDDQLAREERSASARLDGREALRQLRATRNPDGGNLSGSAALAVVEAMRDLGIGGVGHEPGRG